MSNGETLVEKRLRGIETNCSAQMARYIAVKNEISDHESRLREIEKLAPALRLVMWVGAALGFSIVGLIWALITGQVQLVFL